MKGLKKVIGQMAEEIESLKYSNESIQRVIDIRLDLELLLRNEDQEMGDDLKYSFQKFEELLDEKALNDDNRYFDDAIDDLLTDISTLFLDS